MVCSKVVKTMAKGHLTSLPMPAEAPTHPTYSGAREWGSLWMLSVLSRMWVGWVMVKETQGKGFRSLGPFPVSSGTLPGQQSAQPLPTHRGGPSAPTSPPLFLKENVREQCLLPWR